MTPCLFLPSSLSLSHALSVPRSLLLFLLFVILFLVNPSGLLLFRFFVLAVCACAPHGNLRKTYTPAAGRRGRKLRNKYPKEEGELSIKTT